MNALELEAMLSTGDAQEYVGSGFKSTKIIDLLPTSVKSLEYPAIAAPDTNHTYVNWHRVRMLLIWVPTAVSAWTKTREGKRTLDPGERVDPQYTREITWGRHGVIATETWLIRKSFLWNQYVSTERGTVYVAKNPNKTRVKKQTMSVLPKLDEAIGASDAPEVGEGEAVALGVARQLAQKVIPTTNVVIGAVQMLPKAVTAVLSAAGTPAPSLPTVSQTIGAAVQSPGFQFVINNIMKIILSDNALMASIYDSTGMWVREVSARPRVLRAN